MIPEIETLAVAQSMSMRTWLTREIHQPTRPVSAAGQRRSHSH
jgi:hypothetical protein